MASPRRDNPGLPAGGVVRRTRRGGLARLLADQAGPSSQANPRPAGRRPASARAGIRAVELAPDARWPGGRPPARDARGARNRRPTHGGRGLGRGGLRVRGSTHRAGDAPRRSHRAALSATAPPTAHPAALPGHRPTRRDQSRHAARVQDQRRRAAQARGHRQRDHGGGDRLRAGQRPGRRGAALDREHRRAQGPARLGDDDTAHGCRRPGSQPGAARRRGARDRDRLLPLSGVRGQGRQRGRRVLRQGRVGAAERRW